MNKLLAIAAVAIAVAACNKPPAPAQQATSPAPMLQCGKDTDCKGDRICDRGQCVNPPVVAQPSTETASKAASEPAPPSKVSDPVPFCVAGDGRTVIPVWTPEVDDKGNLSSDPPQKDGQIVYIELWRNAADLTCKSDALNSFSRPEDPNEPINGGLAVNIRGNTQFANGICYVRGFFMNEDVMGMHQGWIETYFGAVPKKEVVMSGKYCLEKSMK